VTRSTPTDFAHISGIRSVNGTGSAEDLGTSFATPLVSRTLAQIYHQVTPTPSPVLARALLTHHARDPRTSHCVPDGDENFFGTADVAAHMVLQKRPNSRGTCCASGCDSASRPRKRGVVFGRRPGQRVKADRFAPKVLKLVGAGQSYREISHRLGLSKNTILDIVKRDRPA
jgi:hypothetical protein